MKIKAPEELSKSSKEFFNTIVEEYELESHHIQILIQACQCLDRIEEAREVIKEEGAFYNDRFLKPKVHPAVETEAKYKVIFKNLIRELGLDLEPPKEQGRPPRQY
jgi:phage terminase small subunit